MKAVKENKGRTKGWEVEEMVGRSGGEGSGGKRRTGFQECKEDNGYEKGKEGKGIWKDRVGRSED